ncbi:hypothetical protein Afil01_12800 [Actinorhabdospora filicis]|uniref:DUF1579 domain-containing protein n=1 Tax=Actinorhabdospora filicis TaxID=1785913 RepID=A0A9W6SHN9_9ACTN|nr:hypothetical protein [Actinorhabdospora filicis]GLZ76473.1 hypothetical protein Afil01_12800 [Actinorhabdospora filicis]
MSEFDFFTGTWSVANRRRTVWLADVEEWEEFPATSVCTWLLGGAAMADEMDFPTKNSTGMTLGLRDAKSGEWSLYWVRGDDGVLSEPVVGKINDGDGVFYGETEHDGRPVLVRNLWHSHGPDAFGWVQDYSADGGDTWETNWTMDFTRTDG